MSVNRVENETRELINDGSPMLVWDWVLFKSKMKEQEGNLPLPHLHPDRQYFSEPSVCETLPPSYEPRQPFTIQTVNYMKTSALNTMLFATFYEELI